MVTTFLPLEAYRDFSRRSRAANSTIGSPVWLKFELMSAFIIVLVTYDEEGATVSGCIQIMF